MSYWSPDNIQNIGEQLSTIVRSDQSLTYGENDEIRIKIPASIEFIDPRNTFLTLDCLIDVASGVDENKPRIFLDHKLGGNVLINRMRIMANNESVEIESIEDYNKWCSIIYDYEDNDCLRQQRGLLEGAVPINKDLVNNIDNSGEVEPENNDVKTNPYFINDNGTSTYKKAKLCIKLQSGMFRQQHVIPNALLGGLTLIITTERFDRVFEQVETANYRVSGTQYLRGVKFYGKDNTGAIWNVGDTNTELFFTCQNSCYEVDDLPFQIDDTIKLMKADKTEGTEEIVIEGIDFVNNNANNEKLIKLTVTDVDCATVNKDPADGWYLINESIAINTVFNPSYTLSNVDLVVQEVKLTQQAETALMKSLSNGKEAVYDFRSVQNYKYSALLNDIAVNMRLPIVNKKCFAILTMPADASNYTAKNKVLGEGTYAISTGKNSTRSGLVGCLQKIRDYQYYYEKLQPSKPINVEKFHGDGMDAIHMVELSKALKASNILDLSFANVKNNFIIGRAFTTGGNGVYDPTLKDFNIMINSTEAGSKNILFHNFVVHMRRIKIAGQQMGASAGSVSVEY